MNKLLYVTRGVDEWNNDTVYITIQARRQGNGMPYTRDQLLKPCARTFIRATGIPLKHGETKTVKLVEVS